MLITKNQEKGGDNMGGDHRYGGKDSMRHITKCKTASVTIFLRSEDLKV
jgi:hypothetical protein